MIRPLVQRLKFVEKKQSLLGWRPTGASSAAFSTSSTGLTSDSQNDRLLVIGSGVAGSAAALIAAELYKMPVTMLYAGQVQTDCNSFWAQGGIIYRNYTPEAGDSAELLAADITKAGAGLCNAAAVNKVSEEGPGRVRQLLLASQEGNPAFADVPFDRSEETGEMSLCLEASHSAARILFKADHTGRAISKHMALAVSRHPLIAQQPYTVATDLILEQQSASGASNVCIGVETLDRKTGQIQHEFASRGVVLASGGLGGIYEHSTNPAGFNALGSSVALALRAGAAVEDLEYVQFHPTSLFIPNEARFLLTEALRGEGAILRDATGRAFCHDYHPDAELAPRDVVARAVFSESQKNTEQHNTFLDITHRDADWLHGRFPSIQAHVEERGLDLAKDMLPIIPAAHYTCGGIETDLDGCTNIPGLYAAGEAACTGLHGGNRLASTSLLEGLVFGGAVADFVGASDEGRAVRDAASQGIEARTINQSQTTQQSNKNEQVDPAHLENMLKNLRRTMWNHVGLARTATGLEIALEDLGEIQEEIEHLHSTCGPTLETTAVRDAAHAGNAVASAALANPVSAGGHYIIPSEASVADNDSDSDGDMVAGARQY